MILCLLISLLCCVKAPRPAENSCVQAALTWGAVRGETKQCCHSGGIICLEAGKWTWEKSQGNAASLAQTHPSHLLLVRCPGVNRVEKEKQPRGRERCPCSLWSGPKPYFGWQPGQVYLRLGLGCAGVGLSCPGAGLGLGLDV